MPSTLSYDTLRYSTPSCPILPCPILLSSHYFSLSHRECNLVETSLHPYTGLPINSSYRAVYPLTIVLHQFIFTMTFHFTTFTIIFRLIISRHLTSPIAFIASIALINLYHLISLSSHRTWRRVRHTTQQYQQMAHQSRTGLASPHDGTASIRRRLQDSLHRWPSLSHLYDWGAFRGNHRYRVRMG